MLSKLTSLIRSLLPVPAPGNPELQLGLGQGWRALLRQRRMVTPSPLLGTQGSAPVLSTALPSRPPVKTPLTTYYLLLTTYWARASALALLSLLTLSASAADISINATASRNRIYLGETFNLNIEVSGADRQLKHPELPNIPSAGLQLLGSHSNSRSSVSIINGRITRESYEGRIFAYQIKPQQPGTFKTGPVTININGKTHSHPGVTVQVAGLEQQDNVIVTLNASKTSLLVEEPFTLSLSIAVAELPDPYAEHNEPIYHQSPPHIQADFLEMRQPDPGLREPDLNQILNNLLTRDNRQPAFAINNYQSRSMGFGSLFDSDPFRSQPQRFRLPPRRTTIDGRKYREYTVDLNYTPLKEGEYTFGPVTFKGPIIAGVTGERQPEFKEIYTIGPAVTVRVIPPPDEGRPEWFIGSVGRDLTATAAFDTTTCKVGDPLTLTLEITGNISTSNLRAPLLTLQPDLNREFRIYDDNIGSEHLPDGRRFTYRIRPTKAGTLEFPSIKVAYFDTEERTYRTVTTAPIPIQARATTQIATSDTSDHTTGVLDLERGPILPPSISLIPSGAHNDPLLPPRHLALPLLLIPPLLSLITILIAPLKHNWHKLRLNRRRSGALSRTRTALQRATTPAQIADSLRHYLAERLTTPGAALTPAECANLLLAHGVSAEHATTLQQIMYQLDEQLYRPNATTLQDDTRQRLLHLLPQIDHAIRQPKPVAAKEEP